MKKPTAAAPGRRERLRLKAGLMISIHVFRGYDVPDAWGFLIFCAGWTVLTLIVHPNAGIIFADRAFIGYVRVAVEAVAVLSWLVGFIAVAVEIRTAACSAGRDSCVSLITASVFGAFEWLLLFMVTAALTAMLVSNSSRKPGTSTTGSGAAILKDMAIQKFDE
ncbi:uncharacterized protein B0T15DRAFT_489448 [Chaetomium strumarium]|uniref:MARVEL domain-containing protein n=1 Tax=Chaetomium strumarium TaxID=1170767 RepID=A0AAJ0H2V1_9PEZI|nr:hypothetical protein B0T15DRAFT_489448 [Chaetomium strumarium]